MFHLKPAACLISPCKRAGFKWNFLYVYFTSTQLHIRHAQTTPENSTGKAQVENLKTYDSLLCNVTHHLILLHFFLLVQM